MAKDQPELAYKGAIHREVPRIYATFAVAATDGTIDLSPYQGKWIWLKARTLDVTVLRGAVAIAAAGAGMVLLTTDPYFECFVDPGGSLVLHTRSSGVAALEILSDA